jgi:hypothetical protein
MKRAGPSGACESNATRIVRHCGGHVLKHLRRPLWSSVIVLAGLCAGGCAGGTDAGARQPAPALTAAAASITGTIGNQPFYGRAAYLIPSSQWSDGVSRTTVLILQKPVTCRDILGTTKADPVVLPGEYMVKIEFLAAWPIYPGSVWVSKLGTQSRGEPHVGEIEFVTQGSNGAHSGTFIAGEVKVLESTPSGGALSIRAANDPSDPFIRSCDEATRQRLVGIGAVSGSTPLTVCAR